MIVETSCNRKFRVTDTRDVNLQHVWYGVEVKLVKGQFVAKNNARQVLVRKECSTIISWAKE